MVVSSFTVRQVETAFENKGKENRGNTCARDALEEVIINMWLSFTAFTIGSLGKSAISALLFKQMR
jgi:hypothetical protein